MTTNIDTGEQIPTCEKHFWIYMKTLKHEYGRECYMFCCAHCLQKIGHIPDSSEEDFLRNVFARYDERSIGGQTKKKNEQS